MPNYFAHLTFGQKVYDGVSGPLQALLRDQWEGYCCGQYGPDPLFFHYPGLNTPVEREGHDLHRKSPVIVLERLRRPVEEGMPYAEGYALGYLCHYLLDTACHQYVYAHAGADTNSHLAMEGEFDRYLIQKAGYDPRRETPVMRPADKRVYQAAAQGYLQPSPRQFDRAVHSFCGAARALTRLHGTPIRQAVDLCLHRDSAGRGLILARHPNCHAAESNQALEDLLLEQVPVATAQLEEVEHRYRKGLPLDLPWERTFLGEAPEPGWDVSK